MPRPPARPPAAQVISLCEKPRDPPLRHIIVDTPGQIEIFTWSASGAIITELFASGFPTVVAYVVDTPRCAARRGARPPACWHGSWAWLLAWRSVAAVRWVWCCPECCSCCATLLGMECQRRRHAVLPRSRSSSAPGPPAASPAPR
jgi:hypothetical protein